MPDVLEGRLTQMIKFRRESNSVRCPIEPTLMCGRIPESMPVHMFGAPVNYFNVSVTICADPECLPQNSGITCRCLFADKLFKTFVDSFG